MNTKRCLLISCKDLALKDLIWGIEESGHHSESFDISCNTLAMDEKECKRIISYIRSNPADVVFTMNFSPTVSKACKSLGIPYASWIYDCPLQSLYNDQTYNETNHFFIFDKYQLKVCKERGLKNVNYLPLASNISRMGQLTISEQDELQYCCDISFVGMQYVDGRYSYYRNNLPKNHQEELDNIAYNLLGIWDGKDRIHNVMSNELIEAMVSLSSEDPGDKLNLPNRLYFEEVILARAVAYTERRLMMEKITDLAPWWYGSNAEPKDQIEGIIYKPWLTYLEALPKAYNLSKINLSSSLHSIYSGIPLRVFDIMGAGGFILSNYQPEIEELFDIGREIVVYHNFDEMRELAMFFLSHESARMGILIAGYEKVCTEYTYPKAVQKMLEKVFT